MSHAYIENWFYFSGGYSNNIDNGAQSPFSTSLSSLLFLNIYAAQSTTSNTKTNKYTLLDGYILISAAVADDPSTKYAQNESARVLNSASNHNEVGWG